MPSCMEDCVDSGEFVSDTTADREFFSFMVCVSASFSYDFVPVVLRVRHSDQATRYRQDVIGLSILCKHVLTTPQRGLKMGSELITDTRRVISNSFSFCSRYL